MTADGERENGRSVGFCSQRWGPQRLAGVLLLLDPVAMRGWAICVNLGLWMRACVGCGSGGGP
jgi:hypothetical protein|uniref:Uncharacterized protein n=1 Tax=Fagus sylvatica TaxID=28930 RepID=A0A2N9GB34_FAGSY